MSCGKNEPLDTSFLDTAIRNELDNHYDYIRSFSYTINDSKVKGKSREETVTINAVGKYAAFVIEGKLNFIKEESEWVYSEGFLSKTSYVINDYPDTSCVFQKATEEFSDQNVPTEDFSLINSEYNNEAIRVVLSRTVDEHLYSYTCNYFRNFVYEPIREEWQLDRSMNEQYSYDPVLDDLEGEYTLQYEQMFSTSDVQVQIYNCSNEEFTIDYPSQGIEYMLDYPSEMDPLTFTFGSYDGYGAFRCYLSDNNYKQVSVDEIGQGEYELIFYNYKVHSDGTITGAYESKLVVSL